METGEMVKILCQTCKEELLLLSKRLPATGRFAVYFKTCWEKLAPIHAS